MSDNRTPKRYYLGNNKGRVDDRDFDSLDQAYEAWVKRVDRNLVSIKSHWKDEV